ncbi:MAG TPA: type I-U CRISPR-associated protein Csx17 [Candidatus Binataceae bacterium]|nr:type I-U CRISPR-associated protein Csx17 [Candidatus Binataceae bacterium]
MPDRERFDIEIPGCTPQPLMAYLKALGILRLVSEQKDGEARAWWENDLFWLSSSLDRAALVNFFLEEYQPTPILAPWGARSGFYPGASETSARKALEAVVQNTETRLARFREGIASVRTLLDRLALSGKASNEDKLELLRQCRSNLPESVIAWLDACALDTPPFPPLLGTGGNEGSGSYVSGFTQQVVNCVIRRASDDALYTSLFVTQRRGVLTSQTPGHFSPAAAGGPNATQGLEGGSNTNPWDYILCLEGACLWASAVTRRLGASRGGMASFPFTVAISGSGSASLALKDRIKPKQAKRSGAEMWLPMWERRLSLGEISLLLSEGRASLGRRSAITGIDLARAASTLGVDRGIKRFIRTGFLMRNGQSFLSIPLGAFEVTERPSASLLQEIDTWLDRFRRASADKKAPPRFVSALSRIESAIFEFCKHGGAPLFQEVLVSVGNVERELANGGRFRDEHRLAPLGPLSDAWIEASNDSSPEFAIARAVASIYDRESKIGPLRANLEPIDWKKRSPNWAESDTATAWNAANPIANLLSVLERRLMDGERASCEHLPLSFRAATPLDAISAFISGAVDDARIEELLWGLMLVSGTNQAAPHPQSASDIPRAYALLKLLFLPGPLEIYRDAKGNPAVRLQLNQQGGAISIRAEPSIVQLLRANRLGEACVVAMRRLRATGLSPMPMPIRGRRARDRDWLELDRLGGDGLDSRRLAAALLFPVDNGAVNQLFRLVISIGDLDRDQAGNSPNP